MESEDSLSDEYTLFVEEVHTEDLPPESSNAPMPRSSLPNSDVLDDEASMWLDDNRKNPTNLITKSYSPKTFSNASNFEEVTRNVAPSTANTVNPTDATEKINHKSSEMVSDVLARSGTTFVCNGTIIHKITNEDASEKFSHKKLYSGNTKENNLSEATTNHASYNNKISLEVHMNGTLSSAQGAALFNSTNALDKPLIQKNSTANFGSSETGMY